MTKKKKFKLFKPPEPEKKVDPYGPAMFGKMLAFQSQERKKKGFGSTMLTGSAGKRNVR